MNHQDIEIPLGKRTPHYRFYEMLPAVLSYGLILLPVVLSFLNPFIAAIFIIGYIIMWFVKALAIAYRTIQGYQTMQAAQRVDWFRRLNDLEEPSNALTADMAGQGGDWRRAIHYKNLRTIAGNPKKYYRPSEVYNAVIIPVYKEGRETVEPTIQSVLASQYDPKSIIFIIAYEERAGKSTKELAEDMIEKYRSKFHYATAVGHPEGLPDEIIGKGGNINYAARVLEEYLNNEEIDPDKVIVTTLDADNRPHPGYFAHTTYEYIVDLDHKYRAYQPIALYLNNIWDVPAPMRVLATGNSFWTIINSQRPHMLRNFSAHSQGMSSLIETNYWSGRTIVEDGHQYWRSYFTFNGNYEVTPINVPIYQDAVLAETYWGSIKAQFIQLRRWAYGASDVAYVADKAFYTKNNIPFWPVFGRFLRLLDSHVSWATASIIIAFGAWAPLFLSNEANRSIVAHELPIIASQLQTIALAGMFITIFLTFKMLPPRPARYKRHRNLFMLLQWVIMPITSLVYGSAAAFNSQTRLFLGKYLDKFDVTVKSVKK